MFSLIRQRSFTFLKADILQRQGLVHGFGTRRESLREAAISSRGREPSGDTEIPALFQVGPECFYAGTQVHGDRITVLDGADIANGRVIAESFCDGFVTDRPGCAIGIRTADCVPLLMVDTVKRVIGAVHAGWKGTALGIAAKAVTVFIDRYASDPSDIIAVIGPSIGPCCYEVGDEVFGAMKHFAWHDTVFSREANNGRRMLDLGGANRCQLIHAGIADDNVISIPLCTACRRDLFFSWRAEGNAAGRQISGIMLQ